MAILAMCMPILAGKKEKWQAMMDQVANDPNFAASRTDAGVHERSFLQETPKESIIITAITVEKGYFPMEINGYLRMVHLF